MLDGMWTLATLLLVAAPPAAEALATPDARCSHWTLAQDASHLYWGDLGSVRRVPKAGGPVETVAKLNGACVVTGLALDSDTAYFTNSETGALLAAPKHGGEVRQLGSGGQHTQSVAVAGDQVYWTSWEEGAIHSVAKRSGPSAPLVARQRGPDGLAVLGDALYWTNTGPAGAGNKADLMTLQLGQNKPRGKRLSTSCSVFALAGGIAWCGDHESGRILAMDLKTKRSRDLAIGLHATAIAVDARDVWVATGGHGVGGRIVRVPRAGGAVESLAWDLTGLHTVATDETSVAWIEDKRLMRVAKPAGAARTPTPTLRERVLAAGAITVATVEAVTTTREGCVRTQLVDYRRTRRLKGPGLDPHKPNGTLVGLAQRRDPCPAVFEIQPCDLPAGRKAKGAEVLVLEAGPLGDYCVAPADEAAVRSYLNSK